MSEIYNQDDINAGDFGGFPKENVPNSEKQKKGYIKAYLEAMYGNQRKKSAYSGFYENETLRIINNRKWAEGLNSVDEFKPLLGIVDGDVSYVNMDWSIIPVVKKYVNLRVGEMMNIEHKIVAKAIDILSLTKKDEERAKRKAYMKLKPMSDDMAQKTGIPIIPTDEYIPESNEELDIHMDLNFKQSEEIALEKILNYSFIASDWRDRIWEKVCKDFVVIKKSAIKAYFDENYNVRVRYSDWGNMIYPYTVDENFKDCKYAGEIIKVTVSELKRMDKGNDLTDSDLFDIAYKYAGLYGNRLFDQNITTFHQYFERYGKTTTWFDDFLVPVLDGEFISPTMDKWEEKPNNKGGFFYNKKSSDYELDDEKKEKGRKLTSKEIEYKYKGKWVVDTPFIIDYGMAHDMFRKRRAGKISPKCSLSYLMLAPDIMDMENRSMVEDMIPAAKQIQLSTLKIQQLVGKMTPPGLAIDVSALKNVILGKGKEEWTPLQIQDFYLQTGTFYYNGVDDNNLPMNRKPVDTIKDSMGAALQELMALINFYIQQIQGITGINEARDASTPDKDALVGIQKMALQSSRNATRRIDKAALKLFEMSASQMGYMLQYNIEKKRNIEDYKQVIGTSSVEALEALDGVPPAEFGIFIEAKLDEEERMLFEQNASISLAAREIRLEDVQMARQILNTKSANNYLKYRRKKYQEEQMAIAQKNAQDNAAIQERSAMAKAQAEQQTSQVDAQSKIAILQKEYELKDWLAQRDLLRKKEEMELLNKHKLAQIEEASEENFQNTSMTNTVRQPAVMPSVR